MNATLCLLTPPGKAALGVLGLAGPDAWTLSRAVFHRRKETSLPEAAEVGASYVGWLGDAGGADEVVLLVTQDAIEFHCHGGPRVVELLLAHLQKHGARLVPTGEWHDATSPRRLARDILMRAPTLRTAGIALDQFQGARKSERLEQLASVGAHLVKPWQVVLAGAPNVGKSSLINALAGFTRSVVAPTPGTTRDVVSTLIALDGWPIELSDTAGLRGQAPSLESAGIERAREAIDRADLCLWVLDGADAPVWPGFEITQRLDVINKIDLPAAWEYASAPQALRVSAETSEGLAELSDAISRALVPNPPAPGEAVPLAATT